MTKEELHKLIESQQPNICQIEAIRDGKTVYSDTWNNYTRDDCLHVMSVTKSIMALLVGIAIDKWQIKSADDKVLDYFPEYKVKRGEKTIYEVTIKHLLTMRAPYKSKGDPWSKVCSSENWTYTSLDFLGGRKGLTDEFKYSSVCLHILSGILYKATGMITVDYANKYLFEPLGITAHKNFYAKSAEEHKEFTISKLPKEAVWFSDPQGLGTPGYGLCMTAADMAKIGQLCLNNGEFDGKQIVSSNWIREMTRPREVEGNHFRGMEYGYLWWIVDRAKNVYAAIGNSGNVIYINPEKQLVVAVTSYFKPTIFDRVDFIQKYIEPFALAAEKPLELCKLFSQYNLGEVTGDITPVSGGLMHKMFRVQTARETYAVKCLNPQIMKRPGVFENYARAEALEKILEENKLPIVPALTIDGKKMLESGGSYFYIFKWQEGNITDVENISKEQCFKAGEILGKIHALDSQNVDAFEPPLSAIDFAAFLKIAEIKQSPVFEVLKENVALLEHAQSKLNEVRKMLPPMKAISNDDMDPKNIMWKNGKPYVIDLECLDYSNPIESCLNLALQWAGTVNENFSKENLTSFFKGYFSTYDNGFRSYNELFGIAYTWLEWLEYNLKRALGLEDAADATATKEKEHQQKCTAPEDELVLGLEAVAPEEQQLGQDETLKTIARIKYLRSIEKEVCSVLDALPPPDAKKYKTHDDSLCYIELTFEGGLDDIPHYDLPAGFTFVNYKSGDKSAWIDIELSAGEVLSRQHGEECWNRYYGNRETELEGRMFFVEDENGSKIATATAFYDIHAGDSRENGQLHWVAVKKDAQGKGLSKPLITHVLERMKELGYTKIKIPTQTNTWLACKIYHELGFKPEKESLTKDRFGWKMVSLLTGI